MWISVRSQSVFGFFFVRFLSRRFLYYSPAHSSSTACDITIYYYHYRRHTYRRTYHFIITSVQQYAQVLRNRSVPTTCVTRVGTADGVLAAASRRKYFIYSNSIHAARYRGDHNIITLYALHNVRYYCNDRNENITDTKNLV